MRERLHKAARDYASRPSALLGISLGGWDAVLVDALCAEAGWDRSALLFDLGKAFPVFNIRDV